MRSIKMNHSLEDTEAQQRHIYRHSSFKEPAHLLPINELEVRLDIAKEIESFLRSKMYMSNFRLRAEQVAALMTSPLSILKPGGTLSKQDLNDIEMRQRLEFISPFFKYYLQHLGNRQSSDFLWLTGATIRPRPISEYGPQYSTEGLLEPESAESSDGARADTEEQQQNHSSSNSDPKAQKTDEHLHDRGEQAKCLKRDGNACVLLGTVNPKICLIAPFTWNNTTEHAKLTRSLKNYGDCFVEPDIRELLDYVANPSELGASDKAWNMICLDPQLHNLWSRGYFAFKCLDIDIVKNDEAKVTVQFRCMPQTKKRVGQEMDIHRTGPGIDWEELVAEINAFHASDNTPPVIRDGIIQVKSTLGAPLLSGQLFHIQMQKEDAFRFKKMIDMQWACILVAALSGATGSPELLSNINAGDRVMQWIQGQARWEDRNGELE